MLSMDSRNLQGWNLFFSDSDATQHALTLTSNSSSSSSPILVLKENTSPGPARVPAASLPPNKGAEPIASSLTEKRQLGPSSGLAPGLCRYYNFLMVCKHLHQRIRFKQFSFSSFLPAFRTSDCGLSAGHGVRPNVQMSLSLLVSLFLLLKDNLVE